MNVEMSLDGTDYKPIEEVVTGSFSCRGEHGSRERPRRWDRLCFQSLSTVETQAIANMDSKVATATIKRQPLVQPFDGRRLSDE